MPERLCAFVNIFFNALVFFTRLPAPGWVVYNGEYQRRAVCHGPLIGGLIGALAALVLLLCGQLLFLPVAVVISIISTVLVTGALHEDGFADVCDGFGASTDKMRILAIMKDSCIGVYGAIGLGLILLLKYTLLVGIGDAAGLGLLALVLITSHSLSRLAAVSLIYSHDYVSGDGAKSAVFTRPMAGADFGFATACAALPVVGLVYLKGLLFLSALLPVIVARALLARLFVRRLDGYTGDCLGCTQQVCEVCFYLVICILVLPL